MRACGSAVAGRLREDSDLDIAVYFSSGAHLEIEAQREEADEIGLHIALERRYFLAVTDVATHVLAYQDDFRESRERSRSLSEIDRERFRSLPFERYRSDRDLRRSFDRWAETLSTAAIDIAKIVLAAERRPVPRTYGQALADLTTVATFEPLSGRVEGIAAVRNLLAHDYLDLRYARVKRFAEEQAGAIEELAVITERYGGRESA